MTKDQAYQLIDMYIQNDLSPEHKSQFEYWMSQDSDLQLEVELQQLTSEILVSNHLDTVQKEINSFHQKQLRKAKWIKYGVIAGITSLVIISLYLWNKKFSNTNSTLPTTEETTTVIEDSSFTHSPSTVSVKPKIKTNENSTTNNITNEDTDPSSKKSTTAISNVEEKAKELPVVSTTKVEPVLPTHQAYTSTQTIKDPCEGVQIHGKYQVVGTCPNKNDGQIIINKITGGTSPYVYELKHNNQLLSLTHLEYGQYSLTIKDKNNCFITYTDIKIPHLTCQEDYVFNPFIGETWKTVVGNKSGQITVYDISGNIYYQKSFTSNEEIEWNGLSIRGNMQSGQYIYMIKYADGLSTTGKITLVD